MNSDKNAQTISPLRAQAIADAKRMNRELKALRSERSPLTLAAEHTLLGLRK